MLKQEKTKRDIDTYCDSIDLFPKLSPEEEKKIASNVFDSRKEAFKIFLNSNFFFRELVKQHDTKFNFFSKKYFSFQYNRNLNKENINEIISFVRDILKENDQDYKKLTKTKISKGEKQRLKQGIASRIKLCASFLESHHIRVNEIFFKKQRSFFSMLDDINRLDKVSGEEKTLIEKRVRAYERKFCTSRSELKRYLEKLCDKTQEYLKNREQIISGNLRLVVYFASKFKKNEAHFMELIQEGNIGIMKAVDSFNPDVRCKFSTYASLSIVQKFFIYNSRDSIFSIKKTPNLKEALKKYFKFADVLGRPPTALEMKEVLNLKKNTIESLNSFFKKVVSINVEVRGYNYELGDIILAPEQCSPVQEQQRLERIREILKTTMTAVDEQTITFVFKGKVSDLIKDRWGIEDRNPMTLDELATKYSLNSRESVRILIRGFLKRLKQEILSNQEYKRELVDVLPWIDERLDENI